MGPTVIAVLLSLLLGPGMGQLYNREFKKGFILIGFSLFVFLAFVTWLVNVSIPYLPAQATPPEPAVLQDIIQNKVLADHAVTFYTYELLLGILWVYGVVDAYNGAKRRPKDQEAEREA